MRSGSLIEQVYAGDFAGDIDDDTDPAIASATRAIADRVDEARTVVVAELERAGIGGQVAPTAPHLQRHTFDVRVADASAAYRVADTLEAIGFAPWSTWEAGAQRSFDQHATHLTLERTDEVTTVIRVSWADSRRLPRWRRVITPTEGDWAAVTLPAWAWRAYPAVRVVRLVAERLGLRRRHASSLGPFLATPASLLDPLLDVAGAEPGDRVVDLGCGDGRLLVAAARRGCDAIGIEHDPDLVERARARAADAGVADRVTVTRGDARTSALAEADVVFVFLPTDVVGSLLGSLLESMRPGARLLAHEQNRPPADLTPPPDHSEVVVSADALTVAHRWVR